MDLLLPSVLFQIKSAVKVPGVSELEHEPPLPAALLPPRRPVPSPRRGGAEVAADGALADEGGQGHSHPEEVDVEGAHQVAKVQRLDGRLGAELEEALLRGPMQIAEALEYLWSHSRMKIHVYLPYSISCNSKGYFVVCPSYIAARTSAFFQK